MINKNKFLISAGIAALIFLGLQMIYVFVIPKAINISEKTGKIEKILKEKDNIDAKIINPSLKTFWDFSVKFDAEKIDFKAPNNRNIFHADGFSLKINPFKLILKQLALKEFNSENLYIDITRFDKEIFGFGSFFRFDLNSDFTPSFKGANVKIDNYKISIDDRFVNKKFVLQGDTFDIKPFKKNLLVLTASGNLYSEEKCAEFNLNLISDLFVSKKSNLQNYSVTGFIKNINLKQLEPYIAGIPKINSAEGFLNLNFNSTTLNEKKGTLLEIRAETDNIALNKGIYEKQFVLKDKSNLLVKLNAEKNTLNIEQLLFNGNKINAKLSGKVESYTSDKPKLNFDAVIANSRAEEIVNALPYGLCMEINLIKKYGISGDVQGFFKIKGDITEPDIFGKAEGKNLHALRNIDDSHTGKLDLLFEGKKSKIKVDVVTKSHQTFYLDGIIDIYDKDWSYFTVKTSEKLELPLVRAILVPVSEIFDFLTGPLPIINIRAGTGNAVLDIKGIQRKARINGIVNLNDAVGTFDGISALLTKVNAVIDFKNDKIDFYSKNFLVNSFPTNLSGHCDIADDGLFDFTLASNNAETSVLFDIIKKSDMLNEVKNSLKYINNVSGISDVSVKVSGKIDENIDFKLIDMSDFNTEGFLNLKNNKVKLSDFSYPIEKISGKVDFNEKNISFENMKFGLGKSSDGIISGKIDLSSDKDMPMEIKISAPSMDLYDTLKFASNSALGIKYDLKQYKADNFNSRHSLDFSGKINGDEIDFKTASAKIKFLGKTDKISKNYISGGEITVNNNMAAINNLKVKIGGSEVSLNGLISNLTSKKPTYKISAVTKNLELLSVADFVKSGIFGPKAGNFAAQLKEYSGNVNANVEISNKGGLGEISFKNLGFRHIKSDIPVFFPKLDINLTNNKITLNKITGEIGRTGKIPAFADLTIKNYMKIPYIQGKFTTKLNSVFVERYLNTKMTQPVKLTGNVDISSEINGSVDSLRISTIANLPVDSDISYLTTNLGDTEYLRKFVIDTFIHPDNINIKKFEYSEYKVQNSKNASVPLIIASGIFSRKNLVPENFSIETKTKLPAKMLNFVFKKSLIKAGTFDANLKYSISQKTGTGRPTGTINVYNAEIPTFGAVINNVKMKFDEYNVKLISAGRLINTDYNVNADIVNSVKLPFRIKNFTVNTKYLNLDNCINAINKWSIDAYMKSSSKFNSSFNLSDIIIDRGVLNVENMDYKSVPMTNLSSKISVDTNSLVKIDVENLKMAEGKISSNIKYDIKDGSVILNLTADGVDSNIIADAFMGLKNQIQGKFTGKVNLKTKGFDSLEQLENLNGNAEFNINYGRMPKLGSLEYLLRATNLLNSGLTALSVNGVIELLKPFKAGSFEQINGKFNINKGIVKNIEVFSKGSNLSIYLNGLYDMNESNADIVVYGKFGHKIDGLLGGVGNLSLNTFFSLIPQTQNATEYDSEIAKIPDITYKSEDCRVFRATVDGNINENNSVSSFKWIK